MHPKLNDAVQMAPEQRPSGLIRDFTTTANALVAQSDKADPGARPRGAA